MGLLASLASLAVVEFSMLITFVCVQRVTRTKMVQLLPVRLVSTPVPLA